MVILWKVSIWKNDGRPCKGTFPKGYGWLKQQSNLVHFLDGRFLDSQVRSIILFSSTILFFSIFFLILFYMFINTITVACLFSTTLSGVRNSIYSLNGIYYNGSFQWKDSVVIGTFANITKKYRSNCSKVMTVCSKWDNNLWHWNATWSHWHRSQTYNRNMIKSCHNAKRLLAIPNSMIYYISFHSECNLSISTGSPAPSRGDICEKW